MVFVPLTVGFEAASSSSSEGEPTSSVDVILSAPTPQALRVQVEVVDDGASGHDECGSRDYSVPDRVVEFEPGQSRASIELRHLDDDLAEADERFILTLQPPQGATLGLHNAHRHIIVDDDRSLLADVTADFGALGDGMTDDTQAVQQAIDRASDNDDSVVFFPPGSYVVRTLQLAAGVHLVGDQARITRGPDQPNDLQSAVLRYAGDVDSPMTRVQGLTFDGNRDEQAGGFDDWQYRNADLLAVSGGNAQAGRLRVLVEDVDFQYSGASGIRIGANVDVELCAIRGTDVFTDLVQFVGGNSRLSIHSLVADGESGTTGLSLRSGEWGFGDSLRVEIDLQDVQLLTGDLHISVSDDSLVTGSQIEVAAAPLFVRAVRSSVTLRDSSFVVGPALYEFNRIVAPGNVRFENARFVVSETPERTTVLDEQDREIRALDILWEDAQLALEAGDADRVDEVLSDQRLVCDRCSFEIADDVESGDQVFAVGTTLPLGAQPQVQGSNNRVELTNATLGMGVDGAFSDNCTGCVETN